MAIFNSYVSSPEGKPLLIKLPAAFVRWKPHLRFLAASVSGRASASRKVVNSPSQSYRNDTGDGHRVMDGNPS